MRLSELGGYHIIDQSCVSGSLCITYPHVRVNYTDNGTLQEFLFGCCESEDFCNRHISKLLFPDEYYVDINLIPASRKRKIKLSISQSDHDILQLKSSSPRTLSSVKCNNTQSSQNIPTFTNGVLVFLYACVYNCVVCFTVFIYKDVNVFLCMCIFACMCLHACGYLHFVCTVCVCMCVFVNVCFCT